MARRGKSLRAIVTEISRSGERSSLFWWLVDHHDEIVQASQGRRLQWEALSKRFAEAGLTDLSGKPATPHTARITWQRVRRMVAEARERQAAAAPRRVGSVMPSRVPKDWRPPLVEIRREQPMAAAVPAPPSLPAPADPAALAASDPMSEEARLALVPPGMPDWLAPEGRFVSPDDPPEVVAKLLKIEAQLNQSDMHYGPPIKRRRE